MDIKPKDDDGGFTSFFPFNNVYMDPNSNALAELGGLLSLDNDESTMGFGYYEEPPPPTYIPLEDPPMSLQQQLPSSDIVGGDPVRYVPLSIFNSLHFHTILMPIIHFHSLVVFTFMW